MRLEVPGEQHYYKCLEYLHRVPCLIKILTYCSQSVSQAIQNLQTLPSAALCAALSLLSASQCSHGEAQLPNTNLFKNRFQSYVED